MPCHDLETGPQTVMRFDVVGQYSASANRFLAHVCLLDSDSVAFSAGALVKVAHMKPPAQRGDLQTGHVACYVPLTNDQIRDISIWLDEIMDEYKAANVKEQYVIHPPWQDKNDPLTGTRRFRRYSCAGFVIDSHNQVGLDLLDINEDALPEVNYQQIASAYPLIASANRNLLGKFGLEGDGPWRIVLAGYVMHSLNRSNDEILSGPYRAKAGDELF